jgi:hypothetical protein
MPPPRTSAHRGRSGRLIMVWSRQRTAPAADWEFAAVVGCRPVGGGAGIAACPSVRAAAIEARRAGGSAFAIKRLFQAASGALAAAPSVLVDRLVPTAPGVKIPSFRSCVVAYSSGVQVGPRSRQVEHRSLRTRGRIRPPVIERLPVQPSPNLGGETRSMPATPTSYRAPSGRSSAYDLLKGIAEQPAERTPRRETRVRTPHADVSRSPSPPERSGLQARGRGRRGLGR